MLKLISLPLFLVSCFEGYAETDNECPICAPENRYNYIELGLSVCVITNEASMAELTNRKSSSGTSCSKPDKANGLT